MNFPAGLLQNVKSFAAQLPKTVAVACSGGADSIFLTHALHSVYGNNLQALIVNHNLQKNSAVVARQTQMNLERAGIKSVILTWNHNQIITGIEEKARVARYGLIEDFCIANNISTVFIAHHIDDKIETFFMNSVRGCGIAGLVSMREITHRNGITYIRPMVHLLEKLEIIHFLTTNSIPWIEDETNADEKFTRNKLRKSLNFTASQKRGIIGTIQNLEQIYDGKIAQISNFVEEFGTCENITFKMSIANILRIEKSDFRYFVLNVIFNKIYKFSYWEIRQETIERIAIWLESESESATFLKCSFYKKSGNLHIIPEWQRLQEVECEAGQICNWNGLCKLKTASDAKIVPLGKLDAKKRKSLQIKENFLQVAHLPAVICGEKISVPHLGIFEFSVTML